MARTRRRKVLTLTVGAKVIFPFVGLVLLLGLLVSYVAAELVGTSSQGQVNGMAIHEADNVTATFDSFQQQQVTFLRSLTATEGLTGHLTSGDLTALREQDIFPQVANQYPDPIRVSVISTDGKELLGLRVDPKHTDQAIAGEGRDLSRWPHVHDVLVGRADQRGPKFSSVVVESDGPVMYTVGPITDQGHVVGAMLVAEPLQYLAAQASGHGLFELALYEPNGRLLARSQAFPTSVSPLNATQRKAASSSAGKDLVQQRLTVGHKSEEVFYVPWLVRSQSVGYAGVLVPADIIANAASGLPPMMILIFLGALILAALVGVFVTRSITRPLGSLVKATNEVAHGNLDHRAPVKTSDEIGGLTASFNRMTRSLKENKTRLEASTEATLQTLAAAIDARDGYTAGHSMRVTTFSVALATALEMSPEQVELVRRGCMVHDIGKLGVPDRILGKPAKLTDSEVEVMRRHPVLGHQMLCHLLWEREILEIVLHHHERWDGEGYPGRLKGEEIPRIARLVALADTLDAMCSDRPYRDAFSFAVAADEIERCSGTQFDPELVAAFRKARSVFEAMVAEMEPARPKGEIDLTAVIGEMAI